MHKFKSTIFGLGLTSLTAFAQSPENLTIPVHTGWEFSEAHTNQWYEAEVPGTVHQDLIRLNKLPDPFYGTNEQEIQWVEDKDWEYKTTFTLSADQLTYPAALLQFKGLDTYADVYLNGSPILRSENMFVGYDIPVREILREGENKLHIYFHSAINRVLPQWESNGFNYPADNDHHDKRTSVFTRKAPYHYGWDWGIRMVGVGIWRPVELFLYQTADIRDFEVQQKEVTPQKASLVNVLELNCVEEKTVDATVAYRISLDGKEVLSETQKVQLQPGSNRISTPVEIKNPSLWMPNGWGKATLYDFRAEVLNHEGKRIAVKEQQIGLRSLRVVNQEDEHGKSFYFEVNGKPCFAKGANYIPSDIILTNFKKDDYDRLFEDIVAANMNMIRIWGGGIYEEDYFYELADRHGILIWQDFMFGCTSYPADPAFLKQVTLETDYNIKRLRNHACIAMWCGNNEVYEAIKYWGWEKIFSPKDHKQMFTDYDRLFRKHLPEQVAKHDPSRFYIHSSPDSANWGRPEGLGWGDSHYWGVWYGVQPFEMLDTRLSRFMSEFGFQSFPEMKVISSFATPKDYALESEVMKAHQKSSTGNSIIRTYMEMYYHVPEKFEDFVYVGLVLQGQGMRHGFEAHRRNRPYCMGTLYWQLNDSWPVVSWSSIDYYGNWKALHYQARRAFAPVFINAFEENGKLNYYLISDELESRENLRLESKLIGFDGKVIARETRNVDLPANTSTCVWSRDSITAATPEQRRNAFLQLTLKDGKGKELDQQLFYFEKPKDLNLPQTEVKTRIRYKDGAYEVTLQSDKLAKDVFIEIPVQGARFTDNFFDLLPGESKTVIITAPELKKNDRTPITVRHLRQTY